MVRIVNEYRDGDMITDVIGYVDNESMVTMKWKWPKEATYSYCVIFEINDDETIDELVNNRWESRVIYEKGINTNHIAPIMNKMLQYRIYPARKIGNDFEIVNQIKENKSDVFIRKVKLKWTVEYEKSIFSSEKKAKLIFYGLGDIWDDYLCYKVIGGNRTDYLFPIDLYKFKNQSPFDIFVNKNENIEIFLSDKQREYIELVKI
jgi:hypothetical protein